MELLAFLTALLGLIAAAVALPDAIAKLRRKPEGSTVLPPSDPESEAIIERTIWERRPPRRPQGYADPRPPVIAVANMKGGVGKTTVTANLAGYLSSIGKRVLLIDFDYQGSLSQMVLGEAQITDVRMCAHQLLLNKHIPEHVLNYAPPLQFGTSAPMRVFSATYQLSTVENELFAQWISDGSEVRYRTLEYLNSREFKQAFDVALIDCPPRITTATMNALTTSDKLIIPTQPDGLSIPAVEYFSRQVMRMHEETFPKLKLLGVVPSITQQATGLKEREAADLNQLEEKLADIWPQASRAMGPIVMKDAFVPRTGPIRDAAGRGLAFRRDASSRAIFTRLGEAVRRRLE